MYYVRNLFDAQTKQRKFPREIDVNMFERSSRTYIDVYCFF